MEREQNKGTLFISSRQAHVHNAHATPANLFFQSSLSLNPTALPQP